VNTVDTMDMSHCRRECEAMAGRSLEDSCRALEETGKRAPSERRGLIWIEQASPNLKAGVGTLVDTFLRYHFNSVLGAYHGTNTAPFAVSIVNLDQIPISTPCYG
jgi:hypothetical protein